MPSPIIRAANRLGLNYQNEAVSLGPAPSPIIDAHLHLRGTESVQLFAQAASWFGINQFWSMTPWDHVENVHAVLGERVQFIAVPDWGSEDPVHAMGDGFLQRIESFRNIGADLVKFWTAPRARDIGMEAGVPDLMHFDGPHRQAQMTLAVELGMGIMTHVGDPDTWFQTTYSDQSRYGTKLDQYEPFERAMTQHPVPWLAAHMGGWPEDLEFLDGLLTRHPLLHLDTSATKWMVRELSRHSPAECLDFFSRWQGRILFGSDIVVQPEHLAPVGAGARPAQASSPEEALELYASRYWALRTLFESDYVGESPIADPDLAMVDPAHAKAMDAPMLSGKHLPHPVLKSIYHDAACGLITHLRQSHHAASAGTHPPTA